MSWTKKADMFSDYYSDDPYIKYNAMLAQLDKAEITAAVTDMHNSAEIRRLQSEIDSANNLVKMIEDELREFWEEPREELEAQGVGQ